MNYSRDKRYIILVRQYSMIQGHYISIAYKLPGGCDVFHMLGEIYHRTMENINIHTIREFNKSTIKYCNDNQIPIYEIEQKYDVR